MTSVANDSISIVRLIVKRVCFLYCEFSKVFNKGGIMLEMNNQNKSDLKTSKIDKSPSESSSRLSLKRLFGSCISNRGHSPDRDDTVELRAARNELGTTAERTDTSIATTEVGSNPLKKYAPVSVPGWEVNIIYTKNIKRVPRNHSAGDKVRLVDMVDCDTAEVEVKTKKTSKIKQAVLKTVWALKSLVRRIQVNRNLAKMNRKS